MRTHICLHSILNILYIYMYVCMYCVHNTHILYICIYVCVYVCTYVRTYVCMYCIFYCVHNTHISIYTHDVCVCLYVRTNDAKCCCFACCTKPGKPLRNFRELSDNLQCRYRVVMYAWIYNPYANHGPMVLVYLPLLTYKLGDFVANVGKYSSTMEHIIKHRILLMPMGYD